MSTPNDSLTFSSYDVLLTFVKCEVNSELQQRHKIEPLPVLKLGVKA